MASYWIPNCRESRQAAFVVVVVVVIVVVVVVVVVVGFCWRLQRINRRG